MTQRANPYLVTFDVGETLVELDLDFLARRLAERGVDVHREALARAKGPAWQRHDELVAAGAKHPWHALMTSLLEGAGLREVAPLVGWLWDEQPRANLWRKPIAGMIELARELAARRGVMVGVVSNSEGRIAELLAEIGAGDPFAVVCDSGKLGIAKPDRGIFDHALAATGARPEDALHVGDSWPADVVGALGAGWSALFFERRGEAHDDPRVLVARGADATRAAITRWLGERS